MRPQKKDVQLSFEDCINVARFTKTKEDIHDVKENRNKEMEGA